MSASLSELIFGPQSELAKYFLGRAAMTLPAELPWRHLSMHQVVNGVLDLLR